MEKYHRNQSVKGYLDSFQSDTDSFRSKWVHGSHISKKDAEDNDFYASKLTNLMSLLNTIHTVPAKRSPKTGESDSSIRNMIPRFKVMEGNLVLECNNCTHLLLEVRTQFTNDHDLEVVLKDLDSWEGQTKDLDGNESNPMKNNLVVLIV